jgi:non-ribosomal peptide synthetase component F
VTSLREVARSCRATLFAVMLAVYYAQLHRITGQGDLAVASLFANRTRPEVAYTVGFLANMVVLRTRLWRAATFADLVRETHRTVTGALMHQELPYQMVPLDIARADGVRADDVVFQIMAEPLHTMRIAGLQAEALVPEGVGSRFALELALVPRGSGFRAVLFHAEDRFPRAFACNVLAGYASLASSVATAPGMPLASLRG